jgi:hypothetical protein
VAPALLLPGSSLYTNLCFECLGFSGARGGTPWPVVAARFLLAAWEVGFFFFLLGKLMCV